MAKRVVKLGDVYFDKNSLFCENEYANTTISATTEYSAANNHIVYAKKILTPYITIYSGKYGWVSDQQRDALLQMFNDLTNATYMIEYNDGSTDIVRFAWEKGIEFTPIFEGSDHYTVKINLAKV